jgi:hypothetical protein
MVSNIIGRSAGKLEGIRRRLREAPLVALREVLTDQDILDACEVCGYTFRQRQYDPVVTVLHFLMQAIQREESFAATWQELWATLSMRWPERELPGRDLSALTHARGRLPKEVMQCLTEQAYQKVQGVDEQRWRGLRLRALDGTTVSMPASRQLFGHFGRHRARGKPVRYPLGTLVCLLRVGTSLIVDSRFGPYDPGEDKTSRPLLDSLTSEDLLLADRGFSGSPTLARLVDRQTHFLMRKHPRLKPEKLPVLKRLGRSDFITELTVSRPARKQDPWLPKTVRVRIFKATWGTPAGQRVSEWFVTSLMHPGRYPKRTLAKLYHERWQIEISYLEFKQTLHSDVLRSKTCDTIHKELAAHILAYQLVRLLICQAARKHRSKPTQISFLNATRCVVSFSSRMSVMRAWDLPIAYERLLDTIANCQIDVRPGRLEPRSRAREVKHYPRLRTTRKQWRRKRLGA